jgi:hypothetical protein
MEPRLFFIFQDKEAHRSMYFIVLPDILPEERVDDHTTLPEISPNTFQVKDF